MRQISGYVMSPHDALIQAFDLKRLTKSNSLFDRAKLIAFNTEHMRMVPPDRRVRHLRAYLETTTSPVAQADDAMLECLMAMCEGARTLEDIEIKTRFAFVPNDQLEYDPKAVKKVLLKGTGLAMLACVRDRLAALETLTEETIEALLRALAMQIGVEYLSTLDPECVDGDLLVDIVEVFHRRIAVTESRT